MFRKFCSREWIGPGFPIFGIVFGCFQIVVKVTTAQDVIACFVFILHIFRKHGNLAFPDRLTVAVGRHVKFENHQFFSVIHRQSGNTVATVQVKKFTEGCRHRETSPQRIGHQISGKQSKPRFTASMWLGKRIEEEGGVIILCEDGIIRTQAVL